MYNVSGANVVSWVSESDLTLDVQSIREDHFLKSELLMPSID
jgi:hypothetical protein